MFLCGLSMEMELAEEFNCVGKCRCCLYLEDRKCIKHNSPIDCLDGGCDEWVVDHR